MSLATLNGRPIVSGKLDLGRVGAWMGTFKVDVDSGLDDGADATIAIQGLEFKGTVYRGAAYVGASHVRIVGGRGGLRKSVGGRFYAGPPLSLPLGDLLAETGETLSSTSSTAILGSVLPAWARAKGDAAAALRLLVAAAGATWRVLADGTVWVGIESWPVVELDHQVLDERPHEGTMTIATDKPSLVPGVTFRGRRVSSVEIELGGARVRTLIRFESDRPSGRLVQGLHGLVDRRTAEDDYRAFYAATVVSQDADGRLDVLTDDDRFGPGFSSLRIRIGVPGVEVKVLPGSRVMVGFENGQPHSPFAALWDESELDEITVTAVTKVSVVAPQIQLANGVQPVARAGDTAGPYPVGPGNPMILG